MAGCGVRAPPPTHASHPLSSPLRPQAPPSLPPLGPPRRGRPATALPPELPPYVADPSPGGWLVDAARDAPILPLQLALTAASAYLAAAWPARPRGWARSDLIEVRSSPVQGRGIFAKVDIPPGTVLGAYPGRPRTPADMTAKCVAAPGARYYCFRNARGMLLDPTDWSGAPSERPVPGLPWWSVDVTLSYANEPPKASPGVNVTVEDDPKDEEGLIFVALEGIRAGGELFVDYGLDYDRTGYGGG